MRAEYDFSKAKRGALIPARGKTRITIYIDDAVLAEFRARAERAGTGYQTLMNEALKAHLSQTELPVTETVLRRVLREEIPEAKRMPSRGAQARVKAARAVEPGPVSAPRRARSGRASRRPPSTTGAPPGA